MHAQHMARGLMGFVVIRMETMLAINVISDLLKTDEFVVFKTYEALSHKGRDSHIGHTVSIFKYDNRYYYNDPQASILQTFETKENILDVIPVNVTAIDLIYNVYPEQYNPHFISGELLTSLHSNAHIINKNSSIKHGGNISTSSKRKTTNLSTLSNKQTKKRSRKTNTKTKSKSKQ